MHEFLVWYKYAWRIFVLKRPAFTPEKWNDPPLKVLFGDVLISVANAVVDCFIKLLISPVLGDAYGLRIDNHRLPRISKEK